MLGSAASGCARFGFERLDPGGAGGLGASSGLIDPGAGGGAGRAGASAFGGEGGGGGQGAGSEGGAAGLGWGDAGGFRPVDAGPDLASCSDGARNGDEEGADCGGRCPPCSCSLGAPERLGDPNYPGNDLWSPRLANDGRNLYFAVTVPGVGEQIAVATRPDRGSPFGLGQPLPAPVNQGKEGTPLLSFDGQSLYFYSERAGGAGARDLYVATRGGGSDTFDAVEPLSSLNGAELDYLPWLSRDELTIYFASGPAGTCDIFRASRASPGADFEPAEAVTELNTASDEGGITLSADGREAIFASNRPGGVGARDLYRVTRASATEPFGSPVPMDDLNTSENEIDPAFSPDGRELYFASSRDGGDSSIYRALRSCAR